MLSAGEQGAGLIYTKFRWLQELFAPTCVKLVRSALQRRETPSNLPNFFRERVEKFMGLASLIFYMAVANHVI